MVYSLNNSPSKNIIYGYVMVILYNANHKQMHLTTIKAVLSSPHIKQKHPLLTRQQ